MTKLNSLISEINKFVPDREKHNLVETRADHVIHAAIHLLEMVEANFSEEDMEKLEKRLFLAIKRRDPGKFTNSIRKLKEEARKK